MSDRTFVTFETESWTRGEVHDETFHEHGRSILEAIREKLIAGGWTVSLVEEHSFYGVKFTVQDADSGAVRVLLQVPGPWLLNLTKEPTFWERLKRTRNDEVANRLIAAVDGSLDDQHVTAKRWWRREEYLESRSGE